MRFLMHALAPVKDPLALATKICRLLEEPSFRRSIGEKLQITACENFGLDKMVDATEDLYRGLL